MNTHTSMFQPVTLETNKYHFIFYTFSASDSSKMTARVYDNQGNLQSEKVTTLRLFTFSEIFNNKKKEPLIFGDLSYRKHIDIAMLEFHTKAYNISDQQKIIKMFNKEFDNIYNNTAYCYEISSSEDAIIFKDITARTPDIFFNVSGLVVFNISQQKIDFRIFGSEEAYNESWTDQTKTLNKLLVHNEFTPDLEYYTTINNKEVFGYLFSNLRPIIQYNVKIEKNIFGQHVFSLSTNDGPYIRQPRIHFEKKNKYLFDVSDTSNKGYKLAFGTVPEHAESALYQTSRVPGGMDKSKVLLKLMKDDSMIYYFAESTFHMGYVPPSSIHVDYSHNLSYSSKNTIVLDDSPSLKISFQVDKKYIFYQDHPSNFGNVLVIGEEHNSRYFNNYMQGSVVSGTPGTPNSYTMFSTMPNLLNDSGYMYVLCDGHDDELKPSYEIVNLPDYLTDASFSFKIINSSKTDSLLYSFSANYWTANGTIKARGKQNSLEPNTTTVFSLNHVNEENTENIFIITINGETVRSRFKYGMSPKIHQVKRIHNKWSIDGNTDMVLNLASNATHIFSQTDSSNSGHVFEIRDKDKRKLSTNKRLPGFTGYSVFDTTGLLETTGITYGDEVEVSIQLF